MTQSWYRFRSGLSPETFAQVLAAVSIAPRATTPEEAEQTILQELETDLPIRLHHLPRPHQDWTYPLDPTQLAQAWSNASARYDPSFPPRLWATRRIAALPGPRVLGLGDREWLNDLQESLRPIFYSTLLDFPSGHPVRWSWPLRIGVLTKDGTLGELGDPGVSHWKGRLFNFFRAADSHDHFHLLIVDGDGSLAATAKCTSTAVILLGEGPSDLEDDCEILLRLREAQHAPAAVRQPRPPVLGKWLHEMVEEFAHARPLPMVLSMIAGGDVSHPLILADREAAIRMDLTESLGTFARRVMTCISMGARDRLHDNLDDDLKQLVLGVDESAHPDVQTEQVMQELIHLSFERESAGASDIIRVRDALRRTEESAEMEMTAAAPPSENVARVLRARLMRGTQSIVSEPLEPDTDYVIQSSIGPPDEGWLGLDAPFVDPEAPPDDPELGWRLRVMVWEPALIPKPRQALLWLPRRGATLPVSFPIRTTANQTTFGARITVLHENRVLQSGVLVKKAGEPLTWSMDAAPELHLGSIDRDRKFDASILINDDVNGDSRLSLAAGDVLGLIDLDDQSLSKFADQVATYLKRITKDPDAYLTLESKGTEELLRDMAITGSNLYDMLIEDLGLDEDRLKFADRIQIVSAKPTSYFPAEFLYLAEAPSRDASLCPGARAALEADPKSPDAQCKGPHDCNTFCPTQFWSMAKIVERHAYHQQDDPEAPFLFTGVNEVGESRYQVADPLRHLLFAASKKVDEFDANATKNLENALVGLAKGITPLADRPTPNDWKFWEDSIKEDHPSAFIFLPHHYREVHEIFEMGSFEVLPSDLLLRRVRTDDGPKPIVILMGCETVDTKIVFDSFVQKFRRRGASVVISTYATVLGRHAAPATSRFLEVLHARLEEGRVTVGDVLQEIRRTLLAEGMPMVLGLTAYGDADVVLIKRNGT